MFQRSARSRGEGRTVGAILALALLCGGSWAQSGLTTIQDTLFTADGTRFNGTLTIQWSTFDTINPGTVVQQSKTVSVVNGNLQVSLVPNATAPPPANIYTVQYQSDGREQFAEQWTVPVSATPLKVSVVRVGMVSISSSSSAGGVSANQTPILESTVVGLQADLAQRPIKGVGYGTDRVALVNDNGQIETVVGDVGDCVYVDGTAGPCGQITFSDAETPAGIVDGTNNTLTLANPVQGASLMLFRNGLFLTPNFDYTLPNETTIQFAAGAIPQAGDTLTASYRVDTNYAGDLMLNQPPAGLRTAAAQVICSAAGTATSSTSLTTVGACDIPASGLKAGDRIEIRFTFAHTGSASGFSFQANWGTASIVTRTATKQDAAVAGRAEAAITASAAQISTESWGTVLTFLPGIVTASAQTGIQVNFKAAISNAASDSVALTNYTVLRYPGN